MSDWWTSLRARLLPSEQEFNERLASQGASRPWYRPWVRVGRRCPRCGGPAGRCRCAQDPRTR